jgi:hypothetical protein
VLRVFFVPLLVDDDFFFFEAFLRLEGQPCSISAYAVFDTVERDLGRLFPARLRRLMFSTNEFFGAMTARQRRGVCLDVYNGSPAGKVQRELAVSCGSTPPPIATNKRAVSCSR